MEPSDNAPNILVVDDTPANLQLLSRMLKASGYRVRPVPSGRLALQAALSRPPDLVLLDINMPEMSGFDVCRAFKAEPTLADVPIIFISALSDTDNILTAFDVGGVDFVGKPFQFREVKARVDTHLRLRQLQRQLQTANAELAESLQQQKALEQLRDNLVHMIVHDMRSPLMGITAYLQIVEEDGGVLDDQLLDDIHQARACSESLTSMVNDVLDVSRLESNALPLELAPVELRTVVAEGVALLGGVTSDHPIRILGTAVVPCDAQVMARVVSNLVGNSVKFAPAGSAIDVQIEAQDGGARVEVLDLGPGVPFELQEVIFEKFKQYDRGGRGRLPRAGLGLTYCKLAVEAHGGRIGVEMREGGGSRFWFTLPPAAQSS